MAEAATASPATRDHGHTSAATANIATNRPPSTNPKPQSASLLEAPSRLQNRCLIA
jgi:hypothetical protein